MLQNIQTADSTRKSRGCAETKVLLARGRLANAKKWFAHRGWDVLPNNKRGRSVLEWGVSHAWLAGPANPRRSVRNWCRRWAPWLTDTELNDIVAETVTSNKRWSGDHSAMVLEITVRDREALQLWFIGADDDPNFIERLKLKRAKGAASARKYRAKRRSGRPCGRPRLNLSESEKVARKRKQCAASSARHRAANSSGAKRGRPKAAVPAWKAAGFKSKRSYQRHKANGTENASAKTPSCDIKNIDRMTEFSVTEFRCQSAERLKRAGAARRPVAFEGTAIPEPGGFAAAAPPPLTERIPPISRSWSVT